MRSNLPVFYFTYIYVLIGRMPLINELVLDGSFLTFSYKNNIIQHKRHAPSQCVFFQL